MSLLTSYPVDLPPVLLFLGPSPGLQLVACLDRPAPDHFTTRTAELTRRGRLKARSRMRIGSFGSYRELLSEGQGASALAAAAEASRYPRVGPVGFESALPELCVADLRSQGPSLTLI